MQSLFLGDRPGTEKAPVAALVVDRGGIVGDRHYGVTRRASPGRNKLRGAGERPNTRQWSAVSLEELAVVAERIGVPWIDPGWLGANLALAGLPNLTQLPRGTRLVFPGGAILVVQGENLPCINPGRIIASKYPAAGLKPNRFPKAAYGKRGLIGVVQEPGTISLNDLVAVDLEPE